MAHRRGGEGTCCQIHEKITLASSTHNLSTEVPPVGHAGEKELSTRKVVLLLSQPLLVNLVSEKLW